MLHILLLILKIIGIIIAVILGILVLLVCVVLFVPVRYELEAVSTGTFSGTSVKARVTWLLHLVRADVCFEDKKLSWQIRAAWKRIQSGHEGKKTIKAEVETYDEEMEDNREGSQEEAGKEPGRSGAAPEETGKENPGVCKEEQSGQRPKLREDVPQEPERLVDELEREMEKILEAGKNTEGSETADAAQGQEGCEDNRKEREAAVEDGGEERDMDRESCGEEREEHSQGSEEEREEYSQDSEEERIGIWQKIAGICQDICGKIADLYRRITAIPGKISSAAEETGGKIRGLLKKKDKILCFLSDQVHRTAFMKAKEEVFFLLRRLKPGKIQADVHYGFNDPSLTGKVLAGLSMCYPFLGDEVDIRPDFDKKIFDGHLRIKGRLRVSYFVKLLWKLVLSREVRMTYRHVRKFEL